MTEQEKRAKLIELIRKHTRETTVSVAVAREWLIGTGIYDSEGELTEDFGGKKADKAEAEPA